MPETTSSQVTKRAKALAAMEKVMGSFPPVSRRCRLNVTVLEETDCGSYTRRLITYSSEPGSTTPAYLLVPTAGLAGTSHSLPGILSLHSTDRELGHKVVAGLSDRVNRDNAHELAERGYVVIAPAYPLMANYHPDLVTLGYKSGTMKAIWDNTRALDVLDSLPNVAHGQYGAIGHSLGGHNALFTAAFDQRIKAVVTSCGFDSFKDYQGGDLTGWTQDLYMPRLRDYPAPADVPFDFDDVLMVIAPRAVFVNAPLHDSNFSWQSVDRIVEAAAPAYQALGADGAITTEHPDCQHDFPPEVRWRAYEMLDRVLR